MTTIQTNPAVDPRILIHRPGSNDLRSGSSVRVTTEGLKPGMGDWCGRRIDYDGPRSDPQILSAAAEVSALFPDLPVVSNIDRFIGLTL